MTRFVAFEAPRAAPSNYRGKSGGLDGIARSVVWDPDLVQYVEPAKLPRLRLHLFIAIRAALDLALREPNGGAEPGATSGGELAADHQCGGGSP